MNPLDYKRTKYFYLFFYFLKFLDPNYLIHLFDKFLLIIRTHLTILIHSDNLK